MLLLFSEERKKRTLLGPVGPQIRPIKFELAARLRYGLRPKRVGACVVKVRRQPRGPLRGRGIGGNWPGLQRDQSAVECVIFTHCLDP